MLVCGVVMGVGFLVGVVVVGLVGWVVFVGFLVGILVVFVFCVSFFNFLGLGVGFLFLKWLMVFFLGVKVLFVLVVEVLGVVFGLVFIIRVCGNLLGGVFFGVGGVGLGVVLFVLLLNWMLMCGWFLFMLVLVEGEY